MQRAGVSSASVSTKVCAPARRSFQTGSPDRHGVGLQLGIHIRELWRLRAAVAVCVLLAASAGVWTLYKVSLLPPSLTPRAVEMGAASTEVLVDTPDTAILDL